MEQHADDGNEIAAQIGRLSPDTRVKVFNIAKTDKNDLMTEVFRSKAIAVGSPCGQLHSKLCRRRVALRVELKFKGKKPQCSAPTAGLARATRSCEILTKAGFDVVAPEMRINWKPKAEDLTGAEDIAKALLVQ